MDLSVQINMIFNYVSCVTTNPGSHDSPMYARLCREAHGMGTLAHTGDGSDDDDLEESREVEEEANSEAHLLASDGPMQRKDITNPARSGASGQAAGPKHWTQLSANEWTTCRNTGMLKPPRAHYDHVTKRLVLNMDHYCPWMANTVGYGGSPAQPFLLGLPVSNSIV
jgi:palmitoyltransferase